MRRAVRTRAPSAGRLRRVRTSRRRKEEGPGRAALWGVALFFFAAVLSGCSSRGGEDLYERAGAYWDRKMYGMAAEKYEQFSLAHPDHPKADESLYKAAFIHAYYLQDPSGAISRFLRIPARYPESAYRARVHEHLAEIYATHLKSYPQAAAQYDRLIEREEGGGRDLSELYFRKARCYFLMEDWDTARRTHERNLLIHPRGAAADRSAYQIGYIHFLQGRYEAAEEALRFFLETYPDSDWAFDGLLCLARAKEEQHQRLDAEGLYEILRERYPDRSAEMHLKRKGRTSESAR